MPRPHFTSGKVTVPILREAGLAPGPIWTGGKSRPNWNSIPDRPARNQSLYRLSYLAHHDHVVPRLKKEQRYTSTKLLGLRGMLQSELYTYLYLFLPLGDGRRPLLSLYNCVSEFFNFQYCDSFFTKICTNITLLTKTTICEQSHCLSNSSH